MEEKHCASSIEGSETMLNRMESTADSLRYRVAEFLHKYPPFSFLAFEDLVALARTVRIRFYEQDECIFEEGEHPQAHFFVVYRGLVELQKKQGTQYQTVDYCDEGELFGVTALLAQTPYGLRAIAKEESLLYVIPWEQFRTHLDQSPQVARYFASGFAAGMQMLRRSGFSLALAQEHLHSYKSSFSSIATQKIRYAFSPIVVEPELPIARAAELMNKREIGSLIVVNEAYHPIGIVTDSDFRRYVATGKVPVTAFISQIMSAPVITAPAEITVADAMLLMMNHRIRHLCITADGTPNSPVIGILANQDLLFQWENSPFVLIRRISQATEEADLIALSNRTNQLLEQLLEQNMNMRFIARIMNVINDAIVQQAISLSQQRLRQNGFTSSLRFCWLALGSEGRQEKILRTDLDNALVYEDPPAEEKEKHQEYFLLLADRVIDLLLQCGFSPCPAGIMANNPSWCQPLSMWKQYFTRWITLPDEKAIMNTTIFFDLRPVAGDWTLAEILRQEILQQKEQHPIFLALLAKNALQNPPPLGIFRAFLLEKSGEQKDRFDIKARAILPMVDAARVLALSTNFLRETNTFARFEAVAEKEPGNRKIYRDALQAFEFYLQLRVRHGLVHHDTGRYIDPNELSKLERQMLRNTFTVLEAIQQILSVRFKLDHIRS